MWKDIHILLLGERRVGKTSLILSLVSEEFPDDVPNRVEEITIPADVTPEKVPTHIVDYSESEQAEYQLCEEVGRANVVCLVYDLTDLSTLEKVKLKWLPLIREFSMQDNMLPVILVGNKSDLIPDSKMYEAVPIMNEYPEIETCIECSSKTLTNVSEMFYFAQKAVLHPTWPLYSPQDGYLKPESKLALTRIFKLCDEDNDGVLNDEELSNFQRICFSTPLASQALQDVKNVVKKNCTNGVIKECLTLDGFLYLHLLFIQRGRHETTWAVLRKFGYNEMLALTEEYLLPEIQLPGPDLVPQLNEDGKDFLKCIFTKFDKDHDGVLNQAEMNEMFSVFPYEPWGPDVLNTVCTNSKGWITLKGFLSQWMLTTYLDLPRALEYLGYLGYSTLRNKNSQSDAICYAGSKKGEITKISREIFTCKVVGCKGVGKSSFLQGLLQRDLSHHPISSQTSVLAVNEVSLSNQRSAYLLLHEVDLSDLLAAGEGLFMCDVVCLLYDVTDPSSFQHCLEVHKQFVVHSDVSCLVIATKSDFTPVHQHCVMQPADFCAQNNLLPPIQHNQTVCNRGIYQTIATLAANPKCSTTSKHSKFYVCIKIGLAATVAVLFGYGMYKLVSSNKQKVKVW
ncbi:unnamed protein product [Clavelina lepadiformis]|uniref:Mitochondrial Rho GTPase n=1 Tax=Clavelina lepadiformis TaxID=159417 RepID=A0ABP0G1X4_CLALP